MANQSLERIEARCASAELSLALLIGIYRDLSGVAFSACRSAWKRVSTNAWTLHIALTRPAFRAIDASLCRIFELQSGLRQTMAVFEERIKRYQEIAAEAKQIRVHQAKLLRTAADMQTKLERVHSAKTTATYVPEPDMAPIGIMAL